MSSKKIGILGGGQLARMLAEKAPALNLKAYVLSPSEKDPAAQVTPYWKKGDPSHLPSLISFLKKVDQLTFESEFISAKIIKEALQKVNKKIPITPSLKNLSLIQDRLSQKKLIQKHKLKTSPFTQVSFVKNNLTKNTKILHSLFEQLGPFVLKKRTGGYDGYGTFIIKNKNQIKTFKDFSSLFIAEKWIPFKRELALLSVRNKKDIIFLPLVETRQEQARCLWVCGPQTHPQLASLKKKIATFLEKIKYEGVLAFELFDSGKDLLINELAPRVHNSGHYSLDGLTEDQFTLHLKACFQLDLKPPKKKGRGFAMLNLLGEACKKPKWTLIKDIHFYWYEKSISRKGRKMGHLNALGSSPLQALRKVLRARKNFKV